MTEPATSQQMTAVLNTCGSVWRHGRPGNPGPDLLCRHAVCLGHVAVLRLEALAEREPGHDGQPGGALLQGEGYQGGHQQRPDKAEPELRPGAGAGDHSAGADRAGRQHRPVEHGGQLGQQPRHPGATVAAGRIPVIATDWCPPLGPTWATRRASHLQIENETLLCFLLDFF